MKVNLNITPLEQWLPGLNGPLVIAGPCSAETEEQVLATARGLADIKQVRLFRSGIWKPRTRPNSFEGIGEEGLLWLKKVKQETGLLTTTEVANAAHVELCLKHGVDVLWIGARTTVNPFSVQEIADALKGVDIPVLVKNPINPDLQLWIGALERLNQAGITKIGAIHRGFSTFKKTKYRNAPNWNMAIEMKRLIPELPIICDPSHITGNRDLIFSVSQKALDLEMNGLIVETHVTPDQAWSDAAQQITPKRLKSILSRLVVRHEKADTPEAESILNKLRTKIDALDDELLEVLSSRMKIVQQIGEYKRDNQVTILQINRWDQIVNNRVAVGSKSGLKEEFIRDIFDAIHTASIKEQTRIMNESVNEAQSNS
jgi:chorismate mutase